MEKKSKLNHGIFDWLETIVVAFVLALIIRAFFVQVFWIPSSSMEPTLDIKDRIVVNKVSYHFRPPRRQEVVVFREVAMEGSQKRDLIKRLVGLPGEVLELEPAGFFHRSPDYQALNPTLFRPLRNRHDLS